MDFTQSATRADPHGNNRHNSDRRNDNVTGDKVTGDNVIPLAPKDHWSGVEEALASLARHASDAAGAPAPDFSAGTRVTGGALDARREPTLESRPEPILEPSLEPSLGSSLESSFGPADMRNDPTESPLLRRRRRSVFTPLLIAAGIGIAAVLAYQFSGPATQRMIASLAAQLGEPASPSETTVSDGYGVSEPTPAASAPAPIVGPAQTAAAAQSTPERLAPATPSAELQQLEAIARDLATVKQQVEELTAGQARMAREIASLQAAEQDMRRKMAAPPPRPAPARAPAAPVRKPVSALPPPPPPASLAPPAAAEAYVPPPPPSDRASPAMRPPGSVPLSPEGRAF